MGVDLVKEQPEVLRKTVHLGALLLPVAIWFLDRIIWQWPLLLVTLLVIVLDLARLSDRRLNAFFRQMLGPVLRRHEEHELLGSSYLMLACLLAAWIFPREVAVAAMSYLILGDGLAGLVGKKWGRRPLLFGKTWEGTAACLLACLAVGLVCLPSWRLAVAGALIAAIVELLPLPLDDNFAIPLVAGALLLFLPL